MLWPLLLERVPEELAPIVHLMESQHAGVEALLAEIAALLPRRGASDAATPRAGPARRRCTTTCTATSPSTSTPRSSGCCRSRRARVTQEEWDRMGEVGRAGTPRKERSLVFGMFAYDGDPEVVALMLAEAPGRRCAWLVPRLGAARTASHALKVYGTATP